VRIHQGREPEHFRRIFSPGSRPKDQRLVIHERQWRQVIDQDWRVSLFKVMSLLLLSIYCSNSRYTIVCACAACVVTCYGSILCCMYVYAYVLDTSYHMIFKRNLLLQTLLFTVLLLFSEYTLGSKYATWW
jgi:hypothetical protein